jgi:4-oxalocrotonate tautomerase
MKIPIVTIQVTREGTNPGTSSVTAEEKAAPIKGVSQLLLDVLKKPLESSFVVMDEVDTANWGWGGLPVLDYRKNRAASTSQRGGRVPGSQHYRRQRWLRSQLIIFHEPSRILSHVHVQHESRPSSPPGHCGFPQQWRACLVVRGRGS